MSLPRLFGIILPQNTKFELKNKIKSLKDEDKKSLFFLHNKNIILAQKNIDYKKILNESELSCLSGNVAHWSAWRVVKPGITTKIYSNFIVNFPAFIRIPIFVVLFLIKLLWNYIILILSLATRFNFTSRTKNQNILAKDFVFDLLKTAEEKSWTTLILNKTNQADQVTKDLVTRLYPGLKLVWWDHEVRIVSSSNNKKKIKKQLNHENLIAEKPELLEAKDFIKETKPNLILLAIENERGEQEIFIDYLKKQNDTKFILIAGLGEKTLSTLKPTFKIFVKNILEKLQITLLCFWLTTLQEFIQRLDYDKRLVFDIITNRKDEVLVFEQKNGLLTLPNKSIKDKEKIEKSGLVLAKGLNFELSEIRILQLPVKGKTTLIKLSLKQFLGNLCKYDKAEKYFNFIEYSGYEEPKFSKNKYKDYKWISKQELLERIKPELREELEVLI